VLNPFLICLNYKLAGFLIVVGALSGIVCLLAFYLRNFKPESTLGRRIPHWAKELAMSLTGQAVAISVILLGGMNLAPQYLIYISWFVWVICFLKFCFLLPDLVQAGRMAHYSTGRYKEETIAKSQ